MDKIMDKIEEIVNKVVAEFEAKPITTTLKGVIILWFLKQMRDWWSK